MAQSKRTIGWLLAALAIAGPAWAQDGETLFRQQCSACHRLDDRRALGPSLRGVVGRPAASIDGFRYSAGMRDSGITWDEASLRRFLTAPREAVPGTVMAYVGMRDQVRLGAIVAFLGTLK